MPPWLCTMRGDFGTVKTMNFFSILELNATTGIAMCDLSRGVDERLSIFVSLVLINPLMTGRS